MSPPQESSLPELPELGPNHGHRIVIGVDPGTQVMGYGALVVRRKGPVHLASGALRAPKGPVPTRLAHLQRLVTHIFACLRPEVVVVERAFAFRNVQSALRIGEGRGVVLACASAHGAEVIEYTPSEAKKALVGRGGADKSQVAAMVAARLGLDAAPESLDASDALALAIAYLENERWSRQLGSASSPKGG